MKSLRLPLMLLPAIGSAALLVSGCSKGGDTSTAVAQVNADTRNLAAGAAATASDTWSRIKDYTFEKRTDFAAGVSRMSADLDEKTRALKAKFAEAPDAAAKDRDGAVKEYDIACADLKTNLAEMDSATADTWADAKEKVVQSWRRVQAAYQRLNAGPAS